MMGGAVWIVGGRIMAEELRLWAMDGAGGAEPLHTVGGTDSERLLEDTLVNSPDMLDEELQLVGRQLRTASGPLDLLGVDGNGRLVVFELKRGPLQRDSVAQIIDYASYLDNLGDGELLEILTRSAKSHEIENFGEWYASEFGGKDLSSLRPVQITLVGLGVDPTANRMVRYLANGGMGISLLTFSGYHYNGKTLLARQVEVKAQETIVKGSQVSRQPAMTRKERVIARVEEWRESWPEGCDLFHSVRAMFNKNLNNTIEEGSRMRNETADYRIRYRRRVPGTKFSGAGHEWYSSMTFDPETQTVELYFFPLGVEKCLEQFIELEQVLPSRTSQGTSLEQRQGANDISLVLKSLAEWEKHKDKLVAAIQAVYAAYEQAAQEANGGMDENGGC